MDYSRLRNQTLDSSQEEEAVTVNTRALIDKVLARYSGEWTTLRELIQNAADASATRVTIKFETLPSTSVPTPSTADRATQLKHTVLHHTLKRLVVSNNGQPFAETDWSRLKRIAEGNPDETKIGAFGVGFYSVFAECESPFVTSGKDTMAFFWKGNSLFTRRGKLPADMPSPDTCFVLDYRSTTTTVPNLMSICQFLCTSMTFVGLEQIELMLDDWKVFTIAKKAAPATAVSIPKDIEPKSKEGMMRIHAIESQNAQIDASWMNIVGWTPTTDRPIAPQEQDRSSGAPSLRSFFSRLTGSANNSAAARKVAQEEAEAQLAIAEDLTGKSQATVFTRVNYVHIKTTVSSVFSAELERATKKPPPKNTKIAILTSSYDETEASLSTLSGTSSKKVAEIVTSVLPRKAGRIFIGFPTAQTTGLLAHISAPSLIPTVERESIDLNARYVRSWNTELLRVAGIACRIAYAGEMGSLRDKHTSLKAVSDSTEENVIEKLLPAATHILKQFTFRESTPLTKAGEIIEESFWTSNKRASIDILSSRGVKPSHEVRIASEDLSFVKGIAVVPESLLKEAREFMFKIQDFGFISDITTGDIKAELEKQALKEEQLHEFLKWAAKKTRCNELQPAVIQSLFAVTVVNVVSENARPGGSALLVLGEMAFFINGSKISPDLPVPRNTIPFEFTKDVNSPDLQAWGWEELQIVPWLRWLINPATRRELGEKQDVTKASLFAEKVLATTSRAWDNLSASSKSSVVELLSSEVIIPTKQGMRKPIDSYFATVKLFDDLPTVMLNGVKEKFLKSLGVRKTIELSVIFERLMTGPSAGGNEKKAGWSHVDLIKYLVSVWNDIPEQDINQLKNSALCPAEEDGNPSKATSRRYRVHELYEPKDDLRSLGLPVLQWPFSWNAYSNEGKFLRLLGLKAHPSVSEIVDIMSKANKTGDEKKFNSALRYFLNNHSQNNYGSFDMTGVDIAFVPAIDQGKGVVVKPNECFMDEKAAVLGYKVLRPDLMRDASKLGVLPHPPITDCALKLIRQPPLDKRQARELFGYFSGRLSELTPNIADRLGTAAIVPIVSANGKHSVRFAVPTQCFLGNGEEYGEIFDYVDFGEQANVFLLKIGSKHEPTTIELTRLLIREPARIYQTLQTDKYLGLLRKLHVNLSMLKRDKALWKDMKKSPFLLAYVEKPVDPTGTSKEKSPDDPDLLDDETENRVKEWRLRSADKCIIVDDYFCYRLFSAHVVIAPQEESLEDLYWALGAPPISSLVEEEPRLGQQLPDQKEAGAVRELILERTQLFLHEQPSNSVKHDMKWLVKNLEVQVVFSVQLRRTLRQQNVSHTEKRSASLNATSRSKAMLSVTSKPDMWQVSQELVSLLIDRAKPQTIMVFETFMTTSLRKLQSRGYNVDRVLRRKAAEQQRNAELERQRLEEESKKRERELELHRASMATSAQTQAQAQAQQQLQQQPRGATEQTQLLHDQDLAYGHDEAPHSPQNQVAVPGAFNDSPDRMSTDLTRANQQPSRSRGIFSQLTRHLGLDNEESIRRGVQNLFGSQNQATHAPPPYTPQELTTGTRSTQTTPGGVTNPASIQRNLTSAINASQSYTSNSLFTAPQTTNVKELSSYCDSRPSQDLSLITHLPASQLPFYIARSATDPSTFFSQHAAGIDTFGTLLVSVAAVFNLAPRTLHVFYDEGGNSIAFNTSGSMFANYRYYLELHERSVTESAEGRARAFVYWWVVLCHELAHNLVQEHGSDHSYYAEQFVAEYFVGAMGAVASMAGAAGGPRRIESGVERAFS